MIDLPLHTRRFLTLGFGDLKQGARVMFSVEGTEQRAQLPLWQEMLRDSPASCISVEGQDLDRFTVRRGTDEPVSVSLRDEAALASLLACDTLYIDISGLGHQVWAPVVRIALGVVKTLRVIYIEPLSYKPHPSPASPTVFDLSVGFHGLAPLPGFVQLAKPPDDTKTLLVALLGFEGSRPLHLAFQLDSTTKVIPVIGVPGFRANYPAFAVACNRAFLDEYGAHSEIRYARASCPFELAGVLEEVRRDYPEYYMYLAPVGTKPHSLGAIWFAIQNPTATEILYDHPIRKPGRTSGAGLIHVYTLSGDQDA